jgi:hypothetical protein
VHYPFLCPACSTTNPVEYRDDNFYAYRCWKCAAKNAASLRHEKFEALFDFGSMAFLDGYNREAVANFATSLERFFEFYIRTVCLKRGIDNAIITNTWKIMAKQSERQLGAFVALYLLETGEAPSFLDANRLNISFRNAVVHTGKIPPREETVEYADLIYGLTRQLLQSLHETAGESVGQVLAEQIREHGQRAEEEDREYAAYSFEGMFGLERFAPDAIAAAEDEYAARKGSTDPEVAGAAPEHLKTDLSFEQTLEARRQLLDACCADLRPTAP